MAGYLKIYRSLFGHWLWKEKRSYSMAEAWIDLLQLAAYVPTKQLVSGSLVEVPRGGIVASERFLSDRWSWSRSKVKGFIQNLKQDQMVGLEKDQGITVLCICNYDRYNMQKTEEEPLTDQQPDREPARERPPTDHQRANIYSKKEKKEITPPTPSKGEASGFDHFWRAYPKQKNQAQAMRAWHECVSAGYDPQVMIDGAKRYAAEVMREKTEARYIAAPRNWLMDRRWEDEPERPAVSRSGTASALPAPWAGFHRDKLLQLLRDENPADDGICLRMWQNIHGKATGRESELEADIKANCEPKHWERVKTLSTEGGSEL